MPVVLSHVSPGREEGREGAGGVSFHFTWEREGGRKGGGPGVGSFHLTWERKEGREGGKEYEGPFISPMQEDAHVSVRPYPWRTGALKHVCMNFWIPGERGAEPVTHALMRPPSNACT